MATKARRIVKDRGYYMRVWRAERKMTRVEAAKHFGMGPAQWSLLELGQRNAGAEFAGKLAVEIGQPIELFLGIEVTR